MNHDLQNPYHDKDHHPLCYLFHCISSLIIDVDALPKLDKIRSETWKQLPLWTTILDELYEG